MPAIPCKGCGRTTNTAVSDHLSGTINEEAAECYAAFVDGKWVKGCGYDNALDFQKSYATKIIANQKG